MEGQGGARGPGDARRGWEDQEDAEEVRRKGEREAEVRRKRSKSSPIKEICKFSN